MKKAIWLERRQPSMQIPQINDSLTSKYVNITLLRAFVALPPGRARRLGCIVIPKYGKPT